MSTVRRSSVIKPGRPELKFAHTTPPRSTPVPLPTSTPSSTPPGGRNCSRGTAAARDRHQAAGAKGGHRPQIRRIAAPLFPLRSLHFTPLGHRTHMPLSPLCLVHRIAARTSPSIFSVRGGGVARRRRTRPPQHPQLTPSSSPRLRRRSAPSPPSPEPPR